MIIALNMSDEAQKESIFIDEIQLSKIIGKPCIKTSATKKIGVTKLLDEIISKFQGEKLPNKLFFSNVIEEEIENISKILKENSYRTNQTYRQIALNLLKENKTIYIESQEQISELWNLLNEVADGESFINSRNQVIEDETKDLEKSFMEILVSIFPGKYSKVEEFLLQAGYTKEEIPNLIDRTVGRNNKTDFLYKGKHRLAHDRLLKKKK